MDGTIHLHRLGKAPRMLAKGLHFTYDATVSVFREHPCLWVDRDHILTAQNNTRLVILDTEGAVERTIEVKGAAGNVNHTPLLWFDKQGQITYTCGAHFRIDLQRGTASPLKYYSLGNGFEATVAEDEQMRRTVYCDGKQIGKWVFSHWEAKTAPGVLAFPYVRPSKNAALGYPDGIAIWSTRFGAWRTIEMSVDSLVGWSK
jgi:hypothetical protein